MGEDENSTRYLRREIDTLLDEVMPYFPAIALEGAKGVGKTQTAFQRVEHVLQFDAPGMSDLVAADPSIVNSRQGSVLIDEWQKYPPVWDIVRRAVDTGAPAGAFLLTGSAYPPHGAGIHSGAGRIDTVRMRPFAMQERSLAATKVRISDIFGGTQRNVEAEEIAVGAAEYAEEICRSGFPGIMDLPPRLRAMRLNSYVERLATHEFEELGQRIRDPQSVIRWLTAYAAGSSRTDSYQSILDRATPGEADKPARKTTQGYRRLLEQLMILEPLPAWDPLQAGFPALIRSPKHHLCDPGLAATLLGATSTSLISGDPAQSELFAQLFESFVLLSARVAAETLGAKTWHLRARKGEREVDILVEDMEKRIVGIEVKVSPEVRDDDVAHLHWLREHLGPKWAGGMVVHAGSHLYRRADGIWVVPLAALG